jgi:hypothetical protein
MNPLGIISVPGSVALMGRWLLLAALMLLAFPVWGQPPRQAGSPARLTAVNPAAQVRALLIGIDGYPNVERLEGAVADTRDLAAVLARQGVSDVTTLTEAMATRPAVLGALTNLIARTRRDDFVIIAYSGHGGRRPEAVKGSEPDGLDEFFALHNYASTGPGREDILLDNEMRIVLGRFAATGAQVLFLADSCFGGGMTKDPNPPGTVRKTRAIFDISLVGAAKTLADNVSGGSLSLGHLSRRDDATRELANLTFVAAVEDNVPVTEVVLDGQPRGAASYALARALEGAADQAGNGDGVTTRAELFGYLRRAIRSATGHRQSPVMEPRSLSASAVPLLRHGETAPTFTRPEAIASAAQKTIARALPSVSAKGIGPITHDPRSGHLLAADGTTVAYHQGAGALLSAQQAAAALTRLRGLAEAKLLPVNFSPASGAVRAGEPIELNVPSGLYGRSMILATLGGDGMVTLLYPVGRVDPYREQDSLKQPLVASDQPGFDTVVVIAASQRRSALERALADLHQTKAPEAFADAFATYLRPDDRIGLVSYATLPLGAPAK